MFKTLKNNINRAATLLEKYKIKYVFTTIYSFVFVLLAISFLPNNLIGALLSFLLWLVIFPPFETYLKRSLNINLSKDVKAPMVIFLFFLISLSISSASNTNAPTTNSTKESTTSQSQQTVYPPLPTEKLYKVVKVIDGDTIVADIAGKEQKVRLIGIDTPETTDPNKPVQCFGQEAKEKTSEILLNKEVYLISDDSQQNVDTYGRLLRYVFTNDGTNFDKQLIKDGYAREYTYDKAYKFQTEFRMAQQEAKQNKLGMWAKDTCNY